MFLYNILQAPDIKIDQTCVDNIFFITEKQVTLSQNWTLNIVFVSWDEIASLNKTYRNKDSSTDVLSFHYYDDFSPLESHEIAGEIILCQDRIAWDAQTNNVTIVEQIYMLIIHSLLHILGYDHQNDDDYKTMHALEKSIYREVFGKDFN